MRAVYGSMAMPPSSTIRSEGIVHKWHQQKFPVTVAADGTVSGQPRALDGTAIAAEIKKEVGEEVARLAQQGIRPGLAAVLVGNVAASEIYVRSKVKTCAELA